MRDRAERSQQLEREHEETKLAHREHREPLRAFPAPLKELSDRFEKLKKCCQQLFQELEWLGGERSNSTVSEPQQANLGADKESVLLEAMRKQPAELRAFIARYSYDPFDGPNERPELELPLVAGQYVYIFGDADGDGWYVGELTDGTRGLIPSNLVEEVPGDGRPDDTTVSPETSDWWQGIDDVCPVFS
ncbi:RIMS-binding protein 2-like [Falco cherrug]|uniref:RIMS-binding protein 2-like n=1 Tax=Falco cherrug TaxID=345164 RepID=UPI002478C1B9|nr:RIMS-binding protein 2-like [Falco cherrug]XP_055552517.1 RIMS-binding protein 2-like [Falco cherrug]